MEELRISKEEFFESVRTVSDFMVHVHPFLANNAESGIYSDLKINFFFLGRGVNKDKNHGSNFWNMHSLANREFFSDDEMESVYKDVLAGVKPINKEIQPIYYLMKALYKHIGTPFCFYYSLFNGVGNNRFINADSSYQTQVLPMDFDDIAPVEFNKLRSQIEELGIEMTVVFTGHGYQCLIHLNAPTGNKDVFGQFTSLLIRKGFPVDSTIVDSARVFRLPGFYNAKKYSEPKYKDESVKKAYLVHKSEVRYSIEYVFSRFENLKDVFNKDTIKNLKNDFVLNDRVNKELLKSTLEAVPRLKLGAELYSNYFNFNEVHDAIKRMLIDCPTGFRHKTILALVPYLKNNLRLSINSVQDVFKIWNQIFTHEEIQQAEVKRMVERLFNASNQGYIGRYDLSMKNQFGEISFNSEDFRVVESDTFIKLPYSMFKSFAYNGFWELSKEEQLNFESDLKSDESLSSSAFVMYLLLRINSVKESIFVTKHNFFTKQDILRITEMSESSVERYLKELVSLGLMSREGKEFKLTHVYELDVDTFEININLIENMLFNNKKKLTHSECKAYLIIKFLIHHNLSNATELWLSQSQLGNFLGLTRTSVTKTLSSLRKKEFISMKYKYSSNGKQVSFIVTHY